MGLTSKFFLLLIVCIAFQTICAFPQFNIFRWRNAEYDILKTANDSERDVRKDLLNVKNKAWKETSKMMRKAGGSQQVVECMMNAHQDLLVKVDETATNAIKCIEDVRTKVKGENENSESLEAKKNELKYEVKSCRNNSKVDFKRYQGEFSLKESECFMMWNKPAKPE